jgi:hypothetical protein
MVRRHDPSARSATEAEVQPETRYARLCEDGIAYQVVGEGPPDLVMTTGNYSHVDMVWEDPGIALFLRMLASFSRLIVFDRRGTGASDPLPPGALLAQLDASPMALFFAGTRPERTGR